MAAGGGGKSCCRFAARNRLDLSDSCVYHHLISCLIRPVHSGESIFCLDLPGISTEIIFTLFVLFLVHPDILPTSTLSHGASRVNLSNILSHFHVPKIKTYEYCDSGAERDQNQSMPLDVRIS